MYYIDLSEYKDNDIYFNLFEVFFKNDVLSKENKLKEIGISVSTYRRSRLGQAKMADEIVNKIIEEYSFKRASNEEIDKIERLLNNIYLDVYFKITENYEKYIKTLNEYIKERSILSNILVMFRIFIESNQFKNPKVVIEENINYYNEIVLYKDFYNENILEILTMLDLVFTDNIDNIIIRENYKTPIIYTILANKFNRAKKYYNSLYCAIKAKEILIRENNYKRLIRLNATVISDYNGLGNYKDALILEEEQLRILKSFNYSKEEIAGCLTQYYVSKLGLKDFQYIVDNLIMINNSTDKVILFIAHYFTDGKDFKDYYNNISYTCKKEKDVTNILYNIMNGINKKANLKELNSSFIRQSIINIVNSLF